jgi:cytochrome c oxidase assembly protein subunit 15
MGQSQDQTAAAMGGPHDRAVRVWLTLVAALVVAMIVVGGATRLTDSGLSITEWKPIMGAIPPLSQADWETAFAKYQQIPEFHRVNPNMTLDGFKLIFWWEWAHRFLGRIIGLAFALPLAVFWARGMVRPGAKARYVGVLALGALQGAIGWYMVASGLVDRVDVSHYRLALHLSVAFLILGALTWLAAELRARAPRPHLARGFAAAAVVIVALIYLQVALGAFVAGLKAGLHYNTWPLMNGTIIPDDLFAMSPWLVNLVENATTVQFNHRLIAYVIVGLGLWHAVSLMRASEDRDLRTSAMVLAAVLIGQVTLGIITLLNAVPIGLGIAHQGFAAVVLIVAVRHLWLVRAARA